jgi:hypothetical protein
MSARRVLIRGGLVLVGLASAVGAAVAATGAPPPEPAAAVPGERSATPIGAVDERQSGELAVLRRAATQADALPAALKAMIAAGSGPDLGANPALARLALTTRLGEKLYVVPAQGWVCLASAGGAGGCTPTDQIGEGYSVGLQPIPSGYRVQGIVPDGAGRVEVRGADAVATAQPSGNVWEADVTFEPKTVAWTGGEGEKVVPVFVPSEDGPAAPPPAP